MGFRQLPAIEKELDKYEEARNLSTTSTLKPVPEKWIDFAPLTQIRSGASIKPFIPFDYQELVSNIVDENELTIVVKGRQLGLTEMIANKFLHKALKNPAYLAIILSKTQVDTSNIAKRLRRSIETIPEYAELTTDSLTDLTFKNGGRILFRNATIHGCRGIDSVSDILIDEVAFIPEVEEIYKAVSPCTSMVGKEARTIFLSTPNGQAGFYWNMLVQNNGDRNVLEICESIRAGQADPTQHFIDERGVAKVFIHWRSHPIYGHSATYLEDVARRTGLPEGAIKQEYDLSFSDSDESVFAVSLVNKSCCLNWTKKVEESMHYFIGVDSATIGSDYFVTTVIAEDTNTHKYQLVEMYRSRGKTTDQNIYQTNELIKKYKPISVGVETNGIGQIILEQLSKVAVFTNCEGINTNKTSKERMISRLVLAMEMERLELPKDKTITGELLAFRRVDGKLQAAESSHDDVVMSLALGMEISGFNPAFEFQAHL